MNRKRAIEAMWLDATDYGPLIGSGVLDSTPFQQDVRESLEHFCSGSHTIKDIQAARKAVVASYRLGRGTNCDRWGGPPDRTDTAWSVLMNGGCLKCCPAGWVLFDSERGIVMNGCDILAGHLMQIGAIEMYGDGTWALAEGW